MIRLSASSFAAILALLLLFVAFLFAGGPGAGLDRAILTSAQHAALVPAARLVSDLGSWIAVLIAAAAGAAWLALRRRYRDALVLIVLMVGERPLVELLKEAFDRARPDPHGHLVAVQSMAFPSGHAANAMTLGLGLALLVAHGRWRVPAIALGLLYALLVGGSRLVLGVHWPSDVAGGWTFGVAWTLLLVGFGKGTSAPRDH
ncbi:phosphatase PAP2 family protein [Sphingomonas parva]|uniref:Phosphatase PAP2 family protein n=1 Tax=Sphingomonas parva TaxID=2555898 RepID=A0A4Y8ZSY3_9SPHN|nr:phosphatase PAP2 family protein [Sphingomonas parva]TFI57879.1 phosphatase PAP2 family protein [Sphingomonas parva]